MVARAVTVGRVVSALEKWGLVLETDAVLPSLAAIVAGEKIKGSWWGHPRGSEIFHVSNELADHPDALLAKLVAGKLTWIHRRLWPALLGVARAREPWQMTGLPAPAARLLAQVDASTSLRADQLTAPRDPAERKKAVAALEQRLLVHSTSVHTESGAHARLLVAWDEVARERGVKRAMSGDAGRAAIEQAATGLAAAFDTRVKLPWPR